MLSAAVTSAGFAGLFREAISVDGIPRVQAQSPCVRLAADYLRVPRESIGFVSSNSWDVQDARAFGFSACWVNSDGAPGDELDLPPDAIVRSLGELRAAVGA